MSKKGHAGGMAQEIGECALVFCGTLKKAHCLAFPLRRSYLNVSFWTF